MGKDILVTDFLSEQMLAAGAELVKRLDAASADVKAAFWMYLSEEKIWRLIVASPLVKDKGPRNYYKQIDDANKCAEKEEETVSLNDITVSDTNDQLVQLMKTAISTSDGISNKRLYRNAINGVFIEDAHIYRMNLTDTSRNPNR